MRQARLTHARSESKDLLFVLFKIRVNPFSSLIRQIRGKQFLDRPMTQFL